MVRKRVKQKIRDVKEIIELWIKFGNLIRDSQSKKSSTKEEEQEFLEVKTALARKQQALGAVPIKIMNILSQAMSLEDVAKMPDMQARKVYTEWHEAYLSLNELLGRMESGEFWREMPKPSSRHKEHRHGCLYNIIFFIIFIGLVYVCFRAYENRFNLRSKISGTVFEKALQKFEKIMPKRIFPSFEEEMKEEKNSEKEM